MSLNAAFVRQDRTACEVQRRPSILSPRRKHRAVPIALLFAAYLSGCATQPSAPTEAAACAREVRADIVAIEQAYLLNRFAAFVPGGMMFALRDDVVAADGSAAATPGNAMLRPDKRPRPLVLRVNEGDCLVVALENMLAPQWQEEGGLPREYDGRLPAHVEARAGTPTSRELVRANKVSMDSPATRTASFHIAGLELAPVARDECPVGAACGGVGSNVGLPEQQGLVFNRGTSSATMASFDKGSLAKPGQKVVTRWRAVKEGTYLAYSAAAPVGGEGDGGQIGLGLFAAVNVEPKGSRWYRSQVTHEQMRSIQRPGSDGRHPGTTIDYEKTTVVEGKQRPVLAILDAANRIVHSDLNALIVMPEGPGKGADAPQCKDPARHMFGDSCGSSFREFTVVFHDEIHAQQAFAELDDEDNPLFYIRDGMGINYGASSMGSLVMSTPLQRKVGPADHCPECRAEEFFLSSWANGDPALILAFNEQGTRPIGARYKDDPSNVHHSYLGDPVRFRNLHAGPKETHVFHLHAHQWVLDDSDPDSTYLDSQTISPGATFSYGIEFGGGGNRNLTPGDSIFHCHLYPHFAQGMWELWRVHDTFEDGAHGLYDPNQAAGPGNDPRWRNLPDAEVTADAAAGIKGGIETPALVPIPGQALAPLPTAEFRGYPFYIPGVAGHRPPQPVLDMDVLDPAYNSSDYTAEPPPDKVVNGGLPRHVVIDGTLATARVDAAVRERALGTGGKVAQVIARRVAQQDPVSLTAFAAEWNTLALQTLPHGGTTSERSAMNFHEGNLVAPGLTPVSNATPPHPRWWQETAAYKTQFAPTIDLQRAREGEALFRVNGRARAPGAPYANPCPDAAPRRDYRAAFIQTELTYNRHGWLDPQGRIIILEDDIKDIIDPATRTRLPEPLFFRANSGDCITFKSSNFVPGALNADDFQVYTPTDTIGQHIHLVKFDVTSSDGSGNGWNYEDATFSPDEVRDRIFAYNRTRDADGSAKTAAQKLVPQPHPLFRPGGDIWEAAHGKENDPMYGRLLARGLCPPQDRAESDDQYRNRLHEQHPLCGAQRTTQRWWADPIVNHQGKDNTLRTVFTHDHMGPSSHQQHGLYAALVIEPANSVWTRVNAAIGADDLRLAGAQQAGAATLGCELPPGALARSTLCDKLIGGSDLSRPTRPELRRERDHVLSDIEPREPLRLRSDGGPTATLANIIAPDCARDGDSNTLQPELGRNRRKSEAKAPCSVPNEQTRREFALAIADFGIAYNTALEPINPESRGEPAGMRDPSAIRFGHRHVAFTPARPLGISSEDPGSQYVNYRHEPVALRISDATAKDPRDSARDPLARLGGFEYRQSQRRAFSDQACRAGDQDCLGDMANAFSTDVHARRDEQLARSPVRAQVSQATRDLLRSIGWETRLDEALRDVEQWRRDFNCALYDKTQLPEATHDAPGCRRRIARLEPWRVFGDPATPILPAFDGDPVQIRLVQGAQEAQHIFTMNGVKWRRIPGSNGSGFTNAQPIGISEHFEFDVLMDPRGMPHTDHLYFGSSVDQLWDGLWGVLRSFRAPENPDELAQALSVSKSFPPKPASAVFTSAGLGPLPGANSHRGTPVVASNGGLAPIIAAPPKAMQVDKIEGICSHEDGTEASRRFFDVSVARVCQLLGNCDTSGASGLNYSTRHRILDAQAIVYVLNREADCADGEECERREAEAQNERGHTGTLDELRARFAAGRPIEPLVLRAAAGQCLHVYLRNHLLPRLPDGPAASTDPALPLPEYAAYHNGLPMITDGFNFNQFRMSSTVGMSVPRLTQNPVWGDGSNVALNGAARIAPDLRKHPPQPRDSIARRQGTLVPACRPGDSDVANVERCEGRYLWSTLDFGQHRRAVEFGALPIRSFGDAVKHPAHGLVGAVIIGPEGSGVCKDNRFARLDSPGGGVSAEICVPERNGRAAYRYVDHVLVVQDAVSATQGDLPVRDLSGAEEPDDYGMKAFNYKTEPLWARRGEDPSIGFPERNEMDYSDVLSSAESRNGAGAIVCAAGIVPVPALGHRCDPETPVLQARAGERVRLHFVHPGGHTRQQGLAIGGHSFNPYPWAADSARFDASKGSSIRQGVYNAFGPMMGVSLELTAGGAGAVPMDYLIRSQASFLFDGGLWALLRVAPGPHDTPKD